MRRLLNILQEHSVAIATALLVAVGIWGVLETKSALKATQRAWVSPIGAQLTAALEKNKPIHFAVFLINTGREPAVDVNFQIENSTIDKYDPQYTDMINIKVPENNACNNLSTKTSQRVLAPSNQNIFIANNFDSLHGNPTLVASDDIISGNKFYAINGCIIYNTYEEPHTSRFCYILEKTDVPSGETNPLNIPTISLPNYKPLMTTKSNFATCATGFSAN
jgi:hypothetical protein